MERMILILIVLSLVYFPSNSQNMFYPEYKPDTTDQKCLNDFKNAEKDFLSDSVIHFTEHYKKPYSRSQSKILLADYNIIIEDPKYYGNNCYDFRIEELVKEKYGEDWYEESRKKADSLDAAGLGNRNAKLISNHKNISDYIEDSLETYQVIKLKRRYENKGFHMAFWIDKEGRIWIYSIGLCDNFDVFKSMETNADRIKKVKVTKIYELIHGQKLYYPATRDGVIVKQDLSITRIF